MYQCGSVLVKNNSGVKILNAGNYLIFDLEEVPKNECVNLISTYKKASLICKYENNRYLWYLSKSRSSSSDFLKYYKEIDIDSYSNNFNWKLFKFQEEDVKKLINYDRYILAHETGLGKTVISLSTMAILNSIYNNDKKMKNLVVVPKQIIYQWIEQIKQHTNLSVAKYGDKNFLSADVQIITYARLRIMLPKNKYLVAIFDEANNLKNPKAKQTKASYSVNAEYKYLLSATPIKNTPMEIYSLMKVLDLSGIMFGNYYQFLNTFALKKYSPFLDREIVVGYTNMELLKSKIENTILLRMKTDENIMKQVGSRFKVMYEYRDVDLDTNQKFLLNIIDTKLGDLKSKIPFSESIQDLIADSQTEEAMREYKQKLLPYFTISRQIADSAELAINSTSVTSLDTFYGVEQNNIVNKESPKTKEVIKLLDELKGKTIIFSSFTKMLEIIKRDLDRNNIKTYIASGETKNNAETIEQFKLDNDAKVILMSDVGRYGLDLQFCSNIIMYDLVFTYADFMQREGRISRIGQNVVPTVICLISKDTVDNKMRKFITAKKELNKIIINS